MRPSISFDVIPVPEKEIPYSSFSLLRGEVRRIDAYSSKGDISKYVTRRK